MIRKRRKWLYAATVLVLAIAAGCTNNNEPAPQQQNEAQNQPDNGPDAPPAERKAISSTIYDRSNVPSTEGTTEENRWTKWINANGPVDVKYVAVPATNRARS